MFVIGNLAKRSDAFYDSISDSEKSENEDVTRAMSEIREFITNYEDGYSDDDPDEVVNGLRIKFVDLWDLLSPEERNGNAALIAENENLMERLDELEVEAQSARLGSADGAEWEDEAGQLEEDDWATPGIWDNDEVGAEEEDEWAD